MSTAEDLSTDYLDNPEPIEYDWLDCGDYLPFHNLTCTEFDISLDKKYLQTGATKTIRYDFEFLDWREMERTKLTGYTERQLLTLLDNLESIIWEIKNYKRDFKA